MKQIASAKGSVILRKIPGNILSIAHHSPISGTTYVRHFLPSRAETEVFVIVTTAEIVWFLYGDPRDWQHKVDEVSAIVKQFCAR